MTAAEACREARRQLEAAGFSGENELNSLFFAAAGRPRFDPLHEALSPAEEERFFSLVARRCAGEPLQYLCGDWPFLDFTVKVDARALIPRPETEQLAEVAAEKLGVRAPARILDLCSGTGVLAIALKRAFPAAAVTAVELSPDACALLRENCAALGAAVEAICSDAAAYLAGQPDAAFDLIVCNPPYITPADYAGNYAELRCEPRMAFVGGEDGLFFYRQLIPLCRKKLLPGAPVAFEIGNDQAAAVAALFAESGYSDFRLWQDFSGLDRVAAARA